MGYESDDGERESVLSISLIEKFSGMKKDIQKFHEGHDGCE